MGFCSSMCGCFFFLFNLGLFIGGAVIIGLGIWLAVDSTGLSVFNSIQLPSAVDAGTVWAVAVYCMIGVGCLFFIVGFLGCCGQSQSSKCLLTTYIAFVSLTLLGLVTFAILAVVFNSQINTSFENQMTVQVTTEYNNENVTEASGPSVDYTWNYMQVNMKCCGSTGYEDYQNSVFYNTTGIVVPWSCCTMTTTSSLNINNVQDLTGCRQTATAPSPNTDYLNTEGCYTKIKSWTNTHTGILIGIGFGFAALQVLGIVFACCIQNNIKNEMNFV